MKTLVAPWSLELKSLGILSVAEEEGERNEAAWAAGEAGGTHQKTASLRGAQRNLGWLPH